MLRRSALTIQTTVNDNDFRLIPHQLSYQGGVLFYPRTEGVVRYARILKRSKYKSGKAHSLLLGPYLLQVR